MKSSREETKDRIEVLTCTASEYITSVDSHFTLQQYTLKEVSGFGPYNEVWDSLQTQAKMYKAEVVTDLQVSLGQNEMCIMFGTALIPFPNKR